jgi:hypothetical protein
LCPALSLPPSAGRGGETPMLKTPAEKLMHDQCVCPKVNVLKSMLQFFLPMNLCHRNRKRFNGTNWDDVK